MALSVSRKHGPQAQNRRGGAPKGARASDEARAAAYQTRRRFLTRRLSALCPLEFFGRPDCRLRKLTNPRATACAEPIPPVRSVLPKEHHAYAGRKNDDHASKPQCF